MDEPSQREPRQRGEPGSGTILRVDKSAGHWEAVPVSLLEDTRLSFDTRGFAAWLLARPPNWEIRAGALPYLLKAEPSSHGHVGRDKARRFLRELEQAGYLRRIRTRGPGGCWVWHSVFTAVPTTIDGFSVDGSAVDGLPTDGKGVDINQTLLTPDGFNPDLINLQTRAEAAVDKSQTVVGPYKEIRFPEVLRGEYLASAQALIVGCPRELRQAVLDEVAAMHRHGAVRSPTGLLCRLVQRAKVGTFVPNYAVPYLEKQRREAQQRALLLERRSRGPATGPVSASGIVHGVVAQLREKGKEPDP